MRQAIRQYCAYRSRAAFRVLLMAASLLGGCSAPYPLDPHPARDRTAGLTGKVDSGRAPSGKPSNSPPPRQEASELFGPDVKQLVLSDLLTYALAHSPRIRAARYRFRAREARERAAGWLPDPRFSWTYGFEEIQTRNGPVRNVFSLTQAFPYYGTLRHKRKAAGARADAAREALLKAELELLQDVQRAYFDIALTTRRMDINDRSRNILERFVRVAQTKVAGGEGQQQDILLAEIELSRLENERIDLDQRLVTQKAQLNTLLDREPSAHLPPTAEPSVSEYGPDLDSLIDWMLDNLPELQARRDIVNQNRSRLRIAQLRYVPEITLGVTLSDIGEGPGSAGALHSGRDAVGGRIGINLPLWLPRYSAQTRAAREALEASRAQLAEVKRLAVYRVIEKHILTETALRQVKLLKEVILPKAEQTLRVLEAGYEGGSVGFLKLLEAERSLEKFQLRYEEARAEFEKRFADLERAVGKPLHKEVR